MGHELKFLTDVQFKEDESKSEKIWFQVGEILDFDTAETDDDVLDIVSQQRRMFRSSGSCMPMSIFQMTHNGVLSLKALDWVLDPFGVSATDVDSVINLGYWYR